MIARCPACAQLFPIPGPAHMACPFCAAPLDVIIERALPAPSAPPGARPPRWAQRPTSPAGAPPLAWEDAAVVPWPRRYLLTLRTLLLTPSSAFERAATAPTLASSSAAPPVAPALTFAALSLLPALALQGLFLRRPLLPLAALLAAAFLGSTYQLATTLFTGRRPPVVATLRATCFGLAPMLFAALPVVGLPLGVGWSLVLHVFGLRGLSGLSWIQAILVVLAPLLVIAGSFVYG